MKKKQNILIVIFLLLAIHGLDAQIKINSDAYFKINAGCYLLTNDDLTINSGGLLSLRGCATISGTLTNNAGICGLVVESDASGTGSLIESTGVNATVERFITQDIYHYITPPVSGQAISLLQSGTPHTDFDLFWYDEDYSGGLGPAWIDASAQGDNLEVGSGYAYTYNPSDRTLEFTGTTNQGTITEPVTYTYNAGISTSQWYFGWNLAGNPYPSRLDATSFIADADNDNIYGTLYFWDEGSSYAGGRNDYGAWNLTGATSGGGGKTPNGYIEPGQAFFVHYGSGTGHTSDNITFKNSMRVHDAAVFFKDSDLWRYKISLENDAGDYNETLIGFVPGCSDEFDNKYDGYKLKGNNMIALYSKLVADDGHDYAIQALPPLSSNGVTVKLGLLAGKSGLYTFKVLGKENFNDTVAIYLEDAHLKIYTNLNYDPEYHFAVNNTGEYNDRFYLHFHDYGLDVEEQGEDNGFLIYANHGNVIIENKHPVEKFTAAIYDALGRILHSEEIGNKNRTEIKLNAGSGIYFVSIYNHKQSFSRKVFVGR